METWYKAHTSFYRPEITPVEVERSTDKSVWIKGRRNLRKSDYYQFFKTKLGAIECLRQLKNSKINELKYRIKDIEKTFEKFVKSIEK